MASRAGLLVIMLAAAISACVHPMSAGEINELTTCPKGTTLAKVKKNLLLAGYGIQHEGDEEIITDYRQSGGRSWSRITVIKMDDAVRFKVRSRSESLESVPSSRTSTTLGNSRDRNGKARDVIVTQEDRTERVTNDRDLAYYIEHRAEHEGTKSEVCGN